MSRDEPQRRPGGSILAGLSFNPNQKDKRRNLSYFGHPDDGIGTFKFRHSTFPTFVYFSAQPWGKNEYEYQAESLKLSIDKKLEARCYNKNLDDRFLTAPERKNVWLGGIRTQCEGILAAKLYNSRDEDKGIITVIPEIQGSKISVEEVYRMWLALENAMIRRENLIIIEDPALAHVTKFRTEQWRLLDKFVSCGSLWSIFFSIFFHRYPSLYLFPFCLAIYGFGMLRMMAQKDPASRYCEIAICKQYEKDPDSYVTCDAHVSLRYMRSPWYRMFKVVDFEGRDATNDLLVWGAFASGIFAAFRKIYNLPLRHEIIMRGYEPPIPQFKPLNIFDQLRNRFFTFGKNPGAGRSDIVHWLVLHFLLYHVFYVNIPWGIQFMLEYLEREYRMETSIRYLQFRHLQGDERYEFPARNLYFTMQKDYPNNRILKEMYDHYHQPPQGYYESAEFLESREPKELTLKEAVRRAKISYYRKW